MPSNDSEKIGVLEFGKNSYTLVKGYNIIGSLKTSTKFNNVIIQGPGISPSHYVIKYTSKSVIQIMALLTDTETAINNRIIPPLTWIDLKNNSKIKIENLFFEFKVVAINDDSGLSNHNSSENELDDEDLEEVPCSQEVNESKFRRTIKQSSSSSSFGSTKKDETVPETQFVPPGNASDEENFYIPETQEINTSLIIDNKDEKQEESEDDDDYFQFHTEDFTAGENRVEQSQNLFSFMKARNENVKDNVQDDLIDDEDDDEISKLEWNESTRKSSSLQAIQTDNSLIDEKNGRISVTPELFLTAQSTVSNKYERNRILDTVILESQDIDSQSICGKPVDVNNVQSRADNITPDLNLDGNKEPEDILDRENSITPDINFGDDDTIIENGNAKTPSRESSKTPELAFDNADKQEKNYNEMMPSRESSKTPELRFNNENAPIIEDSFKKPILKFLNDTTKKLSTSATDFYDIATQPLNSKKSINPYDLQTQLLPQVVHPFDDTAEDEPTQLYDFDIASKTQKKIDPYELETQPLNDIKSIDPYDLQTQPLPKDVHQFEEHSFEEEETQVDDCFTKPSTSMFTRKKSNDLQDKYDAETQALLPFTIDEIEHSDPPTQVYPRIQDYDDTIGVFEPRVNSTLIPKVKVSPSNKENALFDEKPPLRTYHGKKSNVLKNNTTIAEEGSSFIERTTTIVEVDFDRESMNELCLAPTLPIGEKYHQLPPGSDREKTRDYSPDSPVDRKTPSTPQELDTLSSQDFDTPKEMSHLPSKERLRMIGSKIKEIVDKNYDKNACSFIFPESSEDEDEKRPKFPKKCLDIEVIEFGDTDMKNGLPKEKARKKRKAKNLTKGLGLFGESSSDESETEIVTETKKMENANTGESSNRNAKNSNEKKKESSKEKKDSKEKKSREKIAKKGESSNSSNKAKRNLKKDSKTSKLFGDSTDSETEIQEIEKKRKKPIKKTEIVQQPVSTAENQKSKKTQKNEDPSSEIVHNHNTRREKKVPKKYNDSANEKEIFAAIGPSQSESSAAKTKIKRSLGSSKADKDEDFTVKRSKRTRKDDSKSNTSAPEDAKISVKSSDEKAKLDESTAYDETLAKPLRRTNRKRSIDRSASTSSSDSTLSSKRRATNTHHVIMFSKIDAKPFENLIAEAGAVVTNSAMEATMLLTTDKIFRTTKFLCAMAKGIFILGPQYLSIVKHRGRIIDPTDDNLIHDKDAEKRYKFQLKKTLNKAKKQPLFLGYEVYITPNTKPIPIELEAIVECSQAKVIHLPTRPKNIEKSFVISNPEDKSLWKKFKKDVPGIKIISTEGFMLSIMQYFKNFDSYILG